MSARERLVGLAGRLAPIVVVAFVGYAVAGATGGFVAGAAVVAGQLPSDRPGAPVAMAACVLLAGAALATVVEATPGPASLSLSFPLEREVAGDLGAAAGILLLAAVVISAVNERPDRPATPPSSPAEGDALPPLPIVLGGLAVLLLAFVVRLVGAPAALDPGLDGVVSSIAGGRALTVGEVGLVPPVAPVLAALWPGGGGAALLAAGVLLVVLVAVLAQRTAPALGAVPARHVVLASSVLAALLPAMWLLDLATASAALVAVGCLLLADPARITTGRAGAAGALAAAGLPARPDTVVLGPVLVVWLLLDRRRGRPASEQQVRSAAAIGIAWAVGLVLWTLVVHGEAGSWNPLRTFGEHTGDGPGAVALVLVVLVDLGAVLVAALGVRRSQRPIRGLLPLVALPAWCVVAGLVLDGQAAGSLSWGAPFVVVLAGWQLACWADGWWVARHPEHRSAQAEVRTSS